ncbi:MAG: hypothetical protein Q8O32_02555 [bacterium]|nr:hypothetical protein [bacterium]
MENFKPETEPRESVERLIEASLEHGIKFDEGQNAIVLEVDPNDLEPEIRQQFFSFPESETADKLSEDKTFVSKVLRVFSAGRSQKEAENQIKAKDIIDSQSEEERAKLAKVPEIYFHQDISIHNDDLKQKLRQAGVEVSGDKLGVLLMYRVRGVDFLNYLLQEAIKRTPDKKLKNRSSAEFAKKQLEKSKSSLSTEEVFKVASALIGFEASDRVRMNNTNRDRLLVYLQQHDFVLDEKIFNKLERTLKLLNANNFYHNDLTERNAMLEFDEEGNIKDIYLIDFEKAADFSDKDFGGEMAILGHYKESLKSKDEKLEEVVEQTIASGEKLRLRVAKAKPIEYGDLQEQILSILGNEDSNNIASQEKLVFALAEGLVKDQAHELLAAVLFDLAKTDADRVKKYISARLASKEINNQYHNLLSRINTKI